MKMCLLHIRKGNPSSDVCLFLRNIKVHQARYSMLLMASFFSLYSFILYPTCTVSLEKQIQRASYHAFISVSECAINGMVGNMMMMAH